MARLRRGCALELQAQAVSGLVDAQRVLRKFAPERPAAALPTAGRPRLSSAARACLEGNASRRPAAPARVSATTFDVARARCVRRAGTCVAPARCRRGRAPRPRCRGGAARPRPRRAAAVDPRRGPVGAVAARSQGETADRGDAGQRLAAEAERGDGFQVVERGDLAGGVARERERQFARAMPPPSSRTRIRRTPPLEVDVDPRARRRRARSRPVP